jgi:hypothetical protein
MMQSGLLPDCRVAADWGLREGSLLLDGPSRVSTLFQQHPVGIVCGMFYSMHCLLASSCLCMAPSLPVSEQLCILIAAD